MFRLQFLALVVAYLSTSQLHATAPHVADVIGRAMQDRDYKNAIGKIEETLKDDDAPRDFLTFLKGRAYHYQQRYDEAIQVFDQFARDFPDSPWARRVRFAKAAAYARLNGFRDAEIIYRTEAEYLLSTDRKQEIADIYLQFARRYFQPADEANKPDYQKALTFFEKALEVAPDSKTRPEVESLVGQCYQNLENWDEAIKQFTQFVEKHPDHQLDVEARFRLGQCQLKQSQHVEARRTWQDLLAKHADGDSPLVAEAAYNLALTYQLPQPPSRVDLDLGVAALRGFVKQYPDHKLSCEAYLLIARSYQHLAQVEDAADALKQFLAEPRYQDRKEVAEARFLLGQFYQMQKRFGDALETWRDYLTKHPAHQRWSEAQQQVINTEYLMAAEQRAAKDFQAARNLWSAFLAKYPLDSRAPQILLSFGRMNYEQKEWNAAIEDWRRLVSKYPDTEPASRAQMAIAVTIEEKLGKLEEALKEYEKVTWGSQQNPAKQRAARLVAKQMSIRTQRVFRTDEQPAIKLTSRNIEQVSVRAYKIDLETYFRKMHLATGVESLDIALIDPDETFEFEIPSYEKYMQTELDISLAALPEVTGGGVLVVTVSSEALEATTMVIQSDLDVIVKSSRDEVFVYAQNMRTGKPWPGARLLLSNGNKVFAEAKTHDDGVFQESFDELKSTEDVRVFAVADQNSASNVIGLQGLGVAQGLANKGYLYTDRPVYRPGQSVNVRGIVRRVANDTYQIDEGKEFKLTVLDPSNRTIWQDDVKLNRFGSFHSTFLVPPDGSQGTYRIQINDNDRQQYQGSFAVQQFKLENIQLTIDTERSVFYRGEKIRGSITAQYYYGAPLVGREVRYRLGNDRYYTAKTDHEGKVPFELETRDLRETQAMALQVELPEHNLATAKPLVIAAQGFALSLSTPRPTYLAGESFEVTVNAVDAEGKPAARQLTISVLEQTVVDNRRGEQLVEKKELQTDEEHGTTRATFTLKKGAIYVLRAEGTDRFDNPVTGQHVVQISGEDDATRLRILASEHTYRVGDAPAIRVHWREEPALALMTYQGAKVLGYRLIELRKGMNEIEVPMRPDFAPNFELALAVMVDGRTTDGQELGTETEARRFHHASSPFFVQRDLVVKMEKPQGDAVTPGEDVEIKITTTDRQGKPVSAELSLAMIEQALMDRFGADVADINSIFRNTTRQSAVRTTSSVSFAYRPKTKAINERLLAEADRLVMEAEEETRLRMMVTPRIVSGSTRLNGLAVRVEQIEEMDESRLGETGTRGRNVLGDVQVQRLEGLDMHVLRGDKRALDQVQSIINGIENLSLQEMPSSGVERFSRQLSSGGMMSGLGGGMMGGLGGGGRGYGSGGATNYPDATEWGALTQRRARLGKIPYVNRQFATPQADFGFRVNIERNGAWFDRNLGIEPRTWDELAPSAANGITAYFKNGEVRQYSETVLAMADNKLLGELQQAGAVLRPNAFAEETGYWNPSIVTGEDGKATVTITMPERSTAWKLIAKGITLDTLAGESQDELLAKKELFGELKLPLALTDGDSTQILATVHNDAIKKGTIDVTLKTTIGEKSIVQTKQIDAADGVQHELEFDLQVKRPDAASDTSDVHVKFELVVKAGERTDRFERSIPLQPFGMPIFNVASGVVDSDTTAWVELPANMPTSSPSLEIVIGPSVERGLLDILLAPALRCQIANQRIAPLSDSITSDLMVAVALQQLFGKSRDAGSPQAAAIDARIRSAIGQIVSAQRDDGGWSWSGAGDSNRYSSARTVWALALAERAGYAIEAEAKTKALKYLRTQIAETANTDYESKAILLHAVAVADRGDFPLANRLYRSRQALSSPALLHLALALATMDRLPLAEDLLKLISETRLQPATGRDARPSRGLAHGSPAEVRALYALALQSVSPDSPQLAKQIEWLNTHRFGHRWAPDKATGPATLALCNWSGKSKYEADRFELEVIVNDRRVANLSFDKDARTETVRVPPELLGRGKQRVNFRLTGRGRYSYQCIMEGFVAADRLVSTTKDWRVQRYYEAAPLERDGKPVNRGFDVVQGSYQSFRNELNELPVGRRGHVALNVWRPGVGSNVSPDQLEYLVVTEPLPSGVSVVEDSVSGGFERFEIMPGAITFFIGNRRGIGTISYDVHGYLPGQYRAAPTVIRDAYQLGQFAVHEAKTVKVLPLGQQSSDEYRLSPRELYELGKWHFGRDQMQPAIEHLTELVENWNLQPKVYQDATRMLLDAHLQSGPPQQVVRHFEVIKERWPEMEITYDKILQIGAAYHDIGEYERSYLIFRATVESSFLTESQVAGFLQSQDELTRSVDVMSSLIRDYPSEPYVAAATFDLAQQVYAMAPQARTNAKLREQKVTRVGLIQQAIERLDGFLTAYPNDPAADKAAFSLATALLEIEQYQRAIGACERFVSRYSDSEDLDSFWYTIGYCHFALGNHTRALDVCRKVVEMKRRDVQTGRLVEAANHFRAIYILGQIYHSLGEAAKAIEQYSRVSERFADAKEAIDYFSHRDIKLPEVTTVGPRKPATVELSFRNVAQCETRVYRIDLMKFSLLRRNLSGITNINLAGISPLHEVTIELGDGKDYRDRQHEMTLPLKEEGAYLVVCRGDDLHTSGLVLVTPLKVDVQEEAASGRVRTTVKNTASDSYVTDVHVKVIGSANDDFVSGETDLRGLFVADGIRGNATVIARADGGRYAFRRGSSYLGPPPEDAARQGQAAGRSDRPAKPPTGPSQGKDELLKGIYGRNSGIMLDNSIRQKGQYFNDKAGVTVESVK